MHYSALYVFVAIALLLVVPYAPVKCGRLPFERRSLLQDKIGTTSEEDDVVPEVLLSTTSLPPKGYSFGGRLANDRSEWIQEKPMPSPRADFTAIVADREILLIGGSDANGNIVQNVTAFNPLTEEYVERTPLPEPRHRAGVASINGYIVVAGGFESGTGDPTSATFIFDTQRDTWYNGPALNRPRGDTCIGAIGNKLYVAGGYSTNYDPLASAEVLDMAMMMDDAVDGLQGLRWEEIESLSQPRGDVMCTVVKDEFFVLGGYYDPDGLWLPDQFQSTVESFSPVRNTWKIHPEMPMKRGDGVAVTIGGDKILVIAGETHAYGQVTQIASHDVMVFDSEFGVWDHTVAIPTSRFRVAAAAIPGVVEKVYVFGGHPLCTTDWETFQSTCSSLSLPTVEAFMMPPEGPALFFHIRESTS